MLGMYVHTHWAYRRPYSARTWTLADWEGYLAGLKALGYDFVMVWPQFDAMSPEPNASDRERLCIISQALDMARERFGMRTAICAAANTIGTEKAASYAFQERPYFVVEKRVNPKDRAEVEALLEGRRNQFRLLCNADALSIIDSDPGGYIGSTNDEFAALVRGQVELYRSFNPSAEFIYWMLAGWESYSRFWERTAADQSGQTEMWEEWQGEDFTATLTLMQEQVPEPWWVYAWLPKHMDGLGRLGLMDKAMYYPYGLIEGEPTFPLVNCSPDALAEGLAPEQLRKCPRGAMANAQTHCLQLPHTTCLPISLGVGPGRGWTWRVSPTGCCPAWVSELRVGGRPSRNAVPRTNARPPGRSGTWSGESIGAPICRVCSSAMRTGS